MKPPIRVLLTEPAKNPYGPGRKGRRALAAQFRKALKGRPVKVVPVYAPAPAAPNE